MSDLTDRRTTLENTSDIEVIDPAADGPVPDLGAGPSTFSASRRTAVLAAMSTLVAAGCRGLPGGGPTTTVAPTTMAPTTVAPTTAAPTTMVPTTVAPTTMAPTTVAPTTVAPTTSAAPTTTGAPTTTTAPTTTAPATTTTTPSGATLTAAVAVNKLTFGARPGLVAQVEAMGVQAWIEQQLNPSGLPDAESRLTAFDTFTNTNKQNYDVQDSDGGQDRLYNQLDHATVVRATYSERQLYEVMCDFWSNHFNTWRNHTWMGFLKTRDHIDVVRTHALGKFSDMLVASTHSPAMLDYLDNLPNDASTPGGVNENYAREVMELHTLGIINGVHVYTEEDVHNVAKIISGWAIDWEDGPGKYNFKFLPWQHSLEAVSVLGGAFSRPARTYGQGYEDGVAFFDVLAHHPSTATYICWKLVRHFVSDVPPMSLVNSAAAVFSANDTAIVPVLRHIFASSEFAASGGAKARRPLEHVVACFRALNAQFGNDWDGHAAETIRWSLDSLNQPLFERPSPDGYPDVAGYWVSSEGMLERWEVAGELAQNWFTNQSEDDRVVVTLSGAGGLLPATLPPTVADLLNWIAANIANIALPPGDVTDMCTAIGYAPTAASSTLVSNAGRLALTFGLMLSHPAFQRR